MALGVMGVVERKVLGPVPRLGQFQEGPQKRRIIRSRLQWGYFHFRALGQMSSRRQNDNAVFNCAFVTHLFLRNTLQRGGPFGNKLNALALPRFRNSPLTPFAPVSHPFFDSFPVRPWAPKVNLNFDLPLLPNRLMYAAPVEQKQWPYESCGIGSSSRVVNCRA